MNIPDFNCSDCRMPCCKRVHEDIDYSYIGRSSLRECVNLFQSMWGDPRVWYQVYKVNYEPKRIGDWAIEKYSINGRQANTFNLLEPDPGLRVMPDTYTKLTYYGDDPDGQPIMSDTLLKSGII